MIGGTASCGRCCGREKNETKNTFFLSGFPEGVIIACEVFARHCCYYGSRDEVHTRVGSPSMDSLRWSSCFFLSLSLVVLIPFGSGGNWSYALIFMASSCIPAFAGFLPEDGRKSNRNSR